MAGARAEHPIVVGVESFGEMTIGEDGHLGYDLKYGMGPMPHATLMQAIRLFGTEVAPRVREQLWAREGLSLDHSSHGV